MTRNILKAAAVLIFVIAYAVAVTGQSSEEATASDPAYVGSKKCKICHKGDKNGNIWETWEAGVHAKAMESLIEKGDDKNPECLSCHTTGYGKGGYDPEADVEKPLDLAHVGCEACHGPGSDYKSKKVMEDREAALAAGMIVPDAATCITCHNENSPTFKGFDFEEYWGRIAHKLPGDEPVETESGE